MTERIKFQYEGHDCERVVTQARFLTQEIIVRGVGWKKDYADYGPGRHPISTMEQIARMIADEILREHLPATGPVSNRC